MKETIQDIDKGVEAYYLFKANAKEEFNFGNPSELNRLGYELLRLGKSNESIPIFKLVATEFPNNANLFDSLREAYYINQQYDLALKSYNKAISFGETTGNSKKMVKKIKSIN